MVSIGILIVVLNFTPWTVVVVVVVVVMVVVVVVANSSGSVVMVNSGGGARGQLGPKLLGLSEKALGVELITCWCSPATKSYILYQQLSLCFQPLQSDGNLPRWNCWNRVLENEGGREKEV